MHPDSDISISRQVLEELIEEGSAAFGAVLEKLLNAAMQVERSAFLQASHYERIRIEGTVRELAVLKAIGINRFGKREILGISSCADHGKRPLHPDGRCPEQPVLSWPSARQRPSSALHKFGLSIGLRFWSHGVGPRQV